MQFPTLEQLRTMPNAHFKGLNVTTKEQEEMIQQVVNERLLKNPITKPIYTGDVPFAIKSKEEELKWQQILDERRAASQVKPVEMGKEAELKIEIVELEAKKEALEAKRFCEFCDSKGARHKSNCTR